MVETGVKINDNIQLEYSKLKMKSTYKFIILKIENDAEVVID